MTLWNRVFPALLLAASVVLLSAGLFAFAPAATDDGWTFDPRDPGIGAAPITRPDDGGSPTHPGRTESPVETLQPGEETPAVGAGAEPSLPSPTTATSPSTGPGTGVTPRPFVIPRTVASPRPFTSPGTSTTAPAAGGATPRPGSRPTPRPDRPPGAAATPRPIATPRPTMAPGPSTATLGNGRATRIVVPAMNIDLPVVRPDLVVPGNRDFYPLCNVAQYLGGFARPGAKGTTYLYAHARKGMFLPLLEASRRNNGRGMIGNLVEVYTSDNRLHMYEIYRVKRHATDLSIAFRLPRGGRQLIMQTSEGPRGHVPKLQVAARPIGVLAANPRDANPAARARACG